MCGIVGYSGNANFDTNKIKILMLSNIVRGTDSTGMYNNGIVTKSVDSPEIFIGKNEIVPSGLFIGHTRKATSGVKTEKGAHPFQHGNIVGVHNGGVQYKHNIEKLLNVKPADYEVDSELLIMAIDKGLFKQTMDVFEGAAALIWSDIREPHRLYFYHNEERPLYIGTAPEGYYISSIEESLSAIGCEEIVSVETDKVFVIESGVLLEKECYKVKKTKSYVFNNSYTPATPAYTKINVGDILISKYSYSGLTKDKFYTVVRKLANQKIDVIDAQNRQINGLYESDFTKITEVYKNDYGVLVKNVANSTELNIFQGDMFKISDRYWKAGEGTGSGYWVVKCVAVTGNSIGTKFTIPGCYIHKVLNDDAKKRLKLEECFKDTDCETEEIVMDFSKYSNLSWIYTTLSDTINSLKLQVASMSSNDIVNEIIEGDLLGLDQSITVLEEIKEDIENGCKD